MSQTLMNPFMCLLHIDIKTAIKLKSCIRSKQLQLCQDGHYTLIASLQQRTPSVEELKNCKMMLWTPQPGHQRTCNLVDIVASVVVENFELLDIVPWLKLLGAGCTCKLDLSISLVTEGGALRHDCLLQVEWTSREKTTNH